MRPLWIAAVLLALLVPVQRQTFRSTIDAVRVDVLALDGERPISGLAAADFEVRDNGVVQRIDAVQVEEVPLSVMFALDISQSVAGKALDDLKRAARSAIAALRPADRAAMLTFSERISLVSNWTANRTELLTALDRVKAGGSTSLDDVAYTALTLRDEQPRRALALIFSDGVDTASWLPPGAVLDTARRADVVVYGVGLRSVAKPIVAVNLFAALDLGSPASPATIPLLSGLAAITGGQMFYADRARGDLPSTFVRVIDEFQKRYVLVYSPRDVATTGWHKLEVRVTSRPAVVKAREGYWR